MAIWKDIIRAAAPAVGSLGGPAGTLIGGVVSRLIPPDERDQFEDWAKYAEKLEADEELDNDARRDKLTARISSDLWKEDKQIPKKRQVDWLVQTVVMSINGDFEIDAPESEDG